MSLNDGVYKATFQTPIGIGFGVVTLLNGRLTGGDSSMYYIGTYRTDGATIHAEIHVRPHSAVFGLESVLGTSNANVTLTGTIVGDGARFDGSSANAPGINMRAMLTPLDATA